MSGQPERKPTKAEALAGAGPLLARMFDKLHGPGRWRAPVDDAEAAQVRDTDRSAAS